MYNNSYGLSPPSQPQPMQTYLPVINCDALADRLVCLASENSRLQVRLRNKEAAERAYSDITVFNEQTYTISRTGAPRVLLNRSVNSAYYMELHPLFRSPPIYVVWLSGVEDALIISAETFFSDKKLISAIQRIPGVEVTIQRTTSTTASLLRHAIDSKVKSIFLDYYGGWTLYGDDAQYIEFPDGRTHASGVQEGISGRFIEPTSSAVMATAVARYLPAFQILTDTFARWMLLVSFHVAGMYSLLEDMGYQIPLALALFSEEPEQRLYIRRLLCWFDDPVITPNKHPRNQAMEVLSRKDQPIFLMDSGRLNKNGCVGIWESALMDRNVTVKLGREEKTFPVRGLLTILSDRPSVLTCASEVLLLDIPPGSLDRGLWLEQEERIADNRDYLDAFVGYVEGHIAELREALRAGHREALRTCTVDLNERCLLMLGILFGMNIFLSGFFKFCAPNIPPFVHLDEEMTKKLVELLRQTTDKELCTSLADQFLMVGREQIERGTVLTYSSGHAPKTEEGPIVYYDWEYLYFNSTAFFQICDALSQSRPAVLRALAEAGLFGGRQINSTTAQTRVYVCTVYGQRKQINVYAVSREAFDNIRAGDPLILDEEEQL